MIINLLFLSQAIPEGDWFCEKCKPNEEATKKKKPPPPPKIVEVNISSDDSSDE